MKAILKNQAGVTKAVKVGFSWTTFFFGPLVPLIRGDLKNMTIILLLSWVVGALTAGIGLIGFGIYYGLKYNGMYTKHLTERGYMPADEHSASMLKAKGIISL